MKPQDILNCVVLEQLNVFILIHLYCAKLQTLDFAKAIKQGTSFLIGSKPGGMWNMRKRLI